MAKFGEVRRETSERRPPIVGFATSRRALYEALLSPPTKRTWREKARALRAALVKWHAQVVWTRNVPAMMGEQDVSRG